MINTHQSKLKTQNPNQKMEKTVHVFAYHQDQALANQPERYGEKVGSDQNKQPLTVSPRRWLQFRPTKPSESQTQLFPHTGTSSSSRSFSPPIHFVVLRSTVIRNQTQNEKSNTTHNYGFRKLKRMGIRMYLIAEAAPSSVWEYWVEIRGIELEIGVLIMRDLLRQ